MVIYLHNGNWEASEKINLERKALESMIVLFLEEFLKGYGCRTIETNTWVHERTDSIIHIISLPRTNA